MKNVIFIAIILALSAALVLLYIGPLSGINMRKIDSASLGHLSTIELIQIRDLADAKLSPKGSLLGYMPWYSTGLGSMLPNPNDVLGKKVTGSDKLKRNNDDSFHETIYHLNEDDVALLASAYMSAGFNIDPDISATSFRAKYGDSYEINIFNYEIGNTVWKNECSVRVSKNRRTRRR